MNIRLRHDALVRTLRYQGTSSVDALADKVDVSRRTVLRDICALRDQGFVIRSDPGRGGGIRLDPQSMQTTTRLSVAEVFALIISVRTMQAADTLPFSTLADDGLAKIEKLLPPDKVRDLRQFLDCLYVGKLSAHQDLSNVTAMDPKLLPAFETAFLQQLCLKFDYTDSQGQQTSRQVEPQAMLMLPPLWYLVAWDDSRQDFRHFRMDRISHPQIVDGLKFRQRHVPFDDDVCPYSAENVVHRA